RVQCVPTGVVKVFSQIWLKRDCEMGVRRWFWSAIAQLSLLLSAEPLESSDSGHSLREANLADAAMRKR
ncbi:MAG: hypothetical protein KDA92_18385, partial [Planctomycetales bacterium]|nr:hypothetical protein [Planctomycetales bacterium]